MVLKIGSSFVYFAKVLDSDTSLASVFTSVLVTLISFFYVYSIASYLEVTVNELQNRVIYLNIFESYVIDKFADHLIISLSVVAWLALSIKGEKRFVVSAIYCGATLIAMVISRYSSVPLDIIALLSLPTILFLLLYNRLISKGTITNFSGLLITNFSALLGIGLGIVAIVELTLPIIFSVSVESAGIRNYQNEIYTLLSSSFSPVLMVVLILCFPVKLLLNEFIHQRFKIKESGLQSHLSTSSVKSRTKIISLGLATILCIALILVPHLPTMNKDGLEVGVDTRYYVNWTGVLAQSNSAFGVIHQAFILNDGDRPLTLLFLYLAIEVIKTDPSATIEFVPLILGPALIMATYFLTRQITSGNDKASLIAAFLTSVSFQTLIGIYAGFYANWLAIMLGYFSFVFLFRFLKMPSKLNFSLFFVLLIGVLLTHIYTWNLMALVMGIFLLAMIKLRYYDRRNAVILLIALLSCVLVDVARANATETPLAIQHIVDTANEQGEGSIIGLASNFDLRWDNIIITMTGYNGLYSNFAILALGVYWLYISSLRQKSTVLLIIFLSIGILPLFFGDREIQSRVLYDIPFQIMGALALSHIINQYHGHIIFAAICVWLIAISLRAMSHLYLVPPS